MSKRPGLYGFLDDQTDTLAADIRAIDGNHDTGAGRLAEQLVERGWRKGARLSQAPPSNPMYGVRPCRGHWHVTSAGEDLALRGDIPTKYGWTDTFTEARAREIAAILNSDPTRITEFDL